MQGPVDPSTPSAAVDGEKRLRPALSIVIPAFNEEARLEESLRQVIGFCDGVGQSTEIVVVDDGSTDRTVEIVEDLLTGCSYLRLLSVKHGGKGQACRAGVAAARGALVVLCDADLSVPIVEVSGFVPRFEEGADIVIASREVPGAVRVGEPGYRHLMGRAFNWLVRLLTVAGIRDTQCGFKCFRTEVAKHLFDLQTISGWGFDVEILFLAQRHGYRIEEVPVDWYHGKQSKVRPIRDAIMMFREIWQIRLNVWRGRYDRDPPGAISR